MGKQRTHNSLHYPMVIKKDHPLVTDPKSSMKGGTDGTGYLGQAGMP